MCSLLAQNPSYYDLPTSAVFSFSFYELFNNDMNIKDHEYIALWVTDEMKGFGKKQDMA
jgi:hypothetical protein